LANRIDTLVAKAWNVIKKTGDTMFETPGDPESGWLTLAKDARDPLHAVPLRQLQATVGSIHLPYTVDGAGQGAGYYGYTFAAGLHNTENTLFGVGAISYGRLSPLFVGENANWDRIGVMTRYNSAPGTNPNIIWGVYSLDEDTLFPDALLLSGSFTTASTTLLWVESTIALSTTAKWLGLAYFCDSATESMGVQEWAEQTAIRQVPGYSPYGATVVSATSFRPNHCLYGEATLPMTTAPSHTVFTLTENDPNNERGPSCGLYLRRAT
jgi:hypothetical protein